jgi:hypothetical protein
MLKGKIATMKEHCHSAELETKASRETIMRLVSETDREQRSTNKFTMDMENCRMVSSFLPSLERTKSELLKEILLMYFEI